MGYGVLGASIFFVCAALVAGGVLVARRLARRDAVHKARAQAWSAGSARLIEQLHGSTFERVTFDVDDPQLVFLGERRAIVTIPEWPTVVVGTRVLHFGDPGFRQAIVALQGDTVRSARTSPDREVVIELGGGTFLIELTPAPPPPHR
ncbi:hypothetical protein ABCS02_06725 [Microbacterium sp. X-17]|uniref:hypothetical protein n=1 Tax=Microbacterium sp. X-17 TaxID=3144404 RepID=UPI0031F5286C